MLCTLACRAKCAWWGQKEDESGARQGGEEGEGKGAQIPSVMQARHIARRPCVLAYVHSAP